MHTKISERDRREIQARETAKQARQSSVAGAQNGQLNEWTREASGQDGGRARQGERQTGHKRRDRQVDRLNEQGRRAR